MCLMKVKEEPDYSVPARVRTYKRTSRRYSSPPRYYTDAEYSRRISRQYEPAYTDRRYDRYSSTRVVEERKPSAVALPPPADPPAPSVHTSPPPPATVPPPPSTHHSHSKLETATSVSRQPSRAPSTRTGTRTHFVEVEHDADSGTSSSSSSAASLDDLRSRTTHKTNHTRNTSHTNKSHRTSVSSSHRPAPSEYSIHEREKEIRRERVSSRPRDQYETYRYVNAPQPDDGYGPPPSQRRSGSRRDYWR